MTREWATFWAALAVIAAATAAVVYAALGRAWSIGSVGEWVSGIGALIAVAAALYIGAREGKLALDVAEADRAERRQEARDAEIRTLKALLLVFNNGVVAVHEASRQMQIADDPHRVAAAFKRRGAVQHVQRGLDDFRMHDMPGTTSVDLLMSCRQYWFGVATGIEDLCNGFEIGTARLDSHWGDVIIDALADEIIRRGGGPTEWEDSGVIAHLRAAEARVRAAEQA